MADEVAPGSAFDGRWRWLGRPWFLVAVVLLALNDHVFKAQVPGWWTGKLSDVVGVVVLAALLAVLMGPRRGLVLTGIGFVALKVVPGVAELATPFLGGETLRDPSDLLALVVLMPMWASLVGGASVRAAARRRATVLPMAGAAAAVLTATATSCGHPPAVLEVLVDGGAFYALTDAAEWATSDDGVRWAPTEPGPAEFGLRSRIRHDSEYGPYLDTTSDPGPIGPQEVCAEDGACYRLMDRSRIERRTAGGDWLTDFHLTREDQIRLRGECLGGSSGVLSSIALLDLPDGGHEVVATVGSDGVLRRGPDGEWVAHSVLDVDAPPVPGTATTAEAVLAVAMTPLWLAATALVFAVGRRRGWLALSQALLVMAGGWVLAVGVTAAYSWSLGVEVAPTRIAVVIGTLALLGSTGVALVVGPGANRAQPPPS